MLKKGVCWFNEHWLKDDKFKAWLEKGKSSVTIGKQQDVNIVP